MTCLHDDASRSVSHTRTLSCRALAEPDPAALVVEELVQVTRRQMGHQRASTAVRLVLLRASVGHFG